MLQAVNDDKKSPGRPGGSNLAIRVLPFPFSLNRFKNCEGYKCLGLLLLPKWIVKSAVQASYRKPIGSIVADFSFFDHAFILAHTADNFHFPRASRAIGVHTHRLKYFCYPNLFSRWSPPRTFSGLRALLALTRFLRNGPANDGYLK